jgi:hypothetical protein
MLTITKANPQGPHVKLEADGSRTHLLGEVHMKVSGPLQTEILKARTSSLRQMVQERTCLAKCT